MSANSSGKYANENKSKNLFFENHNAISLFYRVPSKKPVKYNETNSNS